MSAVLVVAGTDSSGGAGLLRDLRTLEQCGAAALCAVTAVTAQTDAAVQALQLIAPELVRAQIAAALSTGRVGAIKIGMLGTRATVLAVAASLPPRARLPVVLDPVLASTSGGELLDREGRQALCETLLPRVTLLTPNIPEGAALLGTQPAHTEEELLRQARALLALGPAAVLLKGGHARGEAACDVLLTADGELLRLSAARSAARLRGSGCALSAAIAAGLAAGLALEEACRRAKHYVSALFSAA